MRNENEMLETIMNTAKSYHSVLAVYLKGSRANPNAPKDIYRDFDIMYGSSSSGYLKLKCSATSKAVFLNNSQDISIEFQRCS